jgi:hypothetical protein
VPLIPATSPLLAPSAAFAIRAPRLGFGRMMRLSSVLWAELEWRPVTVWQVGLASA